MYRAILFLTILLSTYAAGAIEYRCSSCRLVGTTLKRYCGKYDEQAAAWINGRWVDCLRDRSKDVIRYACSGCSYFPEPPWGIKQCGDFNFTTHQWQGNPRTLECAYTGPGNPSSGSDINLPPIASSGGGYKPGSSDPYYNPNRSAFSPDGTRNMGYESRNRSLYGVPYDRYNLSERLYWETLYGRNP